MPPPDLRWVVSPDHPDNETDATIEVFHLEEFKLTLHPSSGEQLLPSSKVFFVPLEIETCPVQMPESHGGFLDENLSVMVRLPATTSVYVLCLAPPFVDAAVLHTHVRVHASYRSPSPPPPSPPPPAPPSSPPPYKFTSKDS